MQPILTPGTHLLRRGAGGAQAGLHPDSAVLLPERFRDLSGGPRQWHTDPEVVDRLVDRGLALPDDRVVRSSLPAVEQGDAWARHNLAALARRAATDLPATLEARARYAIAVRPFGHPLAKGLAAELEGLCLRAGMTLSRSRRSGSPRAGLTVVPVLVGVGEPHRELVDPWLRDPTPHLVVRLVEGAAVLGPFVEPGSTACLRCLDAYRTAEDPSWPLLVEQYARATCRDRPDGIPEPVDPALAAVALGWAARDLATYAEGGCPSTLGTTIRLAPELEEIETQTWDSHPRCGCSCP